MKQKTFFLVSQVLSSRLKKQTIKHVVDTTFKVIKNQTWLYGKNTSCFFIEYADHQELDLSMTKILIVGA